MRFMVMHGVDTHMESGAPPSQEIIQKMGALVQEAARSRALVTGAGLHRSARRARIEHETGRRRVTNGPYVGNNELLDTFVMIRAGSLEEALSRADELSRALGNVDVEVGPVVEPWDLGVMERPKGNTPGRFLLLCKATPETESGTGPSEPQRAAVAKVLASLKDEGVLIMSDRLAPSSGGARLTRAEKGERRWIDGPFAESKELIAGFCILDLPSRADALSWAERYAGILGDNQVDVRPLAG